MEGSVNKPPPRAGFLFPIILGVASGALLWGSFWVPWLTWFALAPFGLLIRLNAARRWIYVGAWVAGLTFFLPGVQWIRHCDPSAWLGWLLLAVYLSLYLPLSLLAARVMNRRWRVPVLFALPIAWTAAEYLRLTLWTGFGWLMLAHSLYQSPWALQPADIAGVYGVSYLAATVNSALVEFLTLPLVTLVVAKSRKHQAAAAKTARSINPALFWRITLTGVLLASWIAYGRHRLRSAPDLDGPRVALIQTNIPQSLKQDDAAQTLSHVIELTAQARDIPADLFVWPETSYPYLYGDITGSIDDLELDRLRIARRAHLFRRQRWEPDRELGAKVRDYMAGSKKELKNITNQLGMPLLVGLIRNDYRPSGMAQYNSAVLLAPNKGVVGVYDKDHLVPFGEYLPLEGRLRFLRWLMPYEAGIDFGLDSSQEHASMHWGKLNFACLICFEDTLPPLARDVVRKATPAKPIDFLINQSNDGWFQGSAEADYHLAASVFRCVETRRPMLRVSNTGITAVIDGNGVIGRVLTDSSGRSKLIGGFLDVEAVPLDGRTAPYVRLGDWLPQTCLVVIAIFLTMSAMRQTKRGWQLLREHVARQASLPDI